MTCQILFLGSPLLPVAVVQGMCLKFDWFRSLSKPLDLGLTIRGRRVFGDHKTWRGLLINVLFCMLGAAAQARIQQSQAIPPWLPLLDYGRDGLWVGFLMGAGMTCGELPNSFLKRQVSIPPGGRMRGFPGVLFFLLDQVDLAIGIWVFLFFVLKPAPSLVLLSFLITLVLHMAVSAVGYGLKMRQTIV
ncbi:MAG: CDP-archaeol synthase [Thermodesulfobacteriota bacterium]